MSRNVYALLVGINNYKSDEIRPLKGCINDIHAMADYLLTQVDSNANINIKKLIDREATRQAIINGFEEYLCQANSDDIALFYFSGHGSQEPVPPQLRDIEPNGLIETLVCCDSRTENSWDLADKELAVLINRVAHKNPQIIVILDCCHSGGALRDDDINNLLQPRYIEKSEARSVSSFFDPEAIKALFAQYNSGRKEHPTFILPEGKYIFLSACRDSEKAFERLDIQRGVFSSFLTDTLQQANKSLSYQDLFNKTREKVSDFSARQSPQFEVSDSIYANFLFLGDSVVKREHYYIVTYHPDNGWVINAGGVHGISPIYGEEKTLLAIFPLSVGNMGELDSVIALAEVVQVFSAHSQINLSEIREELDTNSTYKAILTSLPLPRLKVYLEGEEPGINMLRKNNKNYNYNQQLSLSLQEVLEAKSVDLKLIARNNSYLIFKPDRDNFILVGLNGYSLESSLQAIEFLEHIARWHNILNLSSDPNSSIPQEAIKIIFYRENYEEITQSNFRCKYQYQNGKWCPPRVHIELTNTSEIKLYCALLNLTELYKIKAFPLKGNSHVVDLNPGETVRISEGRAIPVSIPDKFDQQGITEWKDILKLIVSNRHFDISLLEQPNIGETNLGETNRGMQIRPKQKIIRDSWVTNNFVITTVKPQIEPSDELDKPAKNIPDSSSQINQQGNRGNNNQIFVIIAGVLVLISLIAICLFIGRQTEQQELDEREQSKIHFTLIN